jgi:hypothetical protein
VVDGDDSGNAEDANADVDADGDNNDAADDGTNAGDDGDIDMGSGPSLSDDGSDGEIVITTSSAALLPASNSSSSRTWCRVRLVRGVMSIPPGRRGNVKTVVDRPRS